MSLGLPEFGSRGHEGSDRRFWLLVRVSGLLGLTYALITAASESRSAYLAAQSLERASVEVSQIARRADETRRSLQKNADILVATANVESSVDIVLGDLGGVLPEGVSLLGLRIEYMPDATARLDVSVVARTPEAYDRFLSALSRSNHFTDIKPGAESRPGLVRAALTVNHRPKAYAQ